MRRSAASLVSMLLAASMVVVAAAPEAAAAISPSLRRYPYLTDLVRRGVTVNWATTSVGSGSVRWGRPGHCSANRVHAIKRAITVGTVPEYQWKAHISGLQRGTR